MVNPVRQVLLWAAGNRTLAERLPRMRFVRATVRRFMPGETMEDALAAAASLADSGIPALFTHLGENVADAAEADAARDHYLALLDGIARRGLDVEASIKLTHLGLDLGKGICAERVARLVSRSAELGRHLWIDMESAPYVDPSLEVYRELRSRSENVGLCIQAYLHRTPADVDALLPLEPSIRLVKGAYREPASVALVDRRAIGEAFRRLAVRIARRGGRGRLALGTHDMGLVERIEHDLGGHDAFEVQMLYGIRAADQRRLAAEGKRVRTLISYGDHWYPWFMRRMAEKPSNVWLAARNLLQRGAGQGP
jgi:proline dehydrogenase